MSQQPRCLAFVINSLEGGGAERVMCKLLEIMQPVFEARQLTVWLVLLDNLPEAHRCPEYVHKRTLTTQGSLVKGYRQLKQALAEIAPDQVLSFLTRANMLNVVLARTLGYRCVISERVNTCSHFAGGVKDSISKLLVRTTYPRADNVMAVSAGVKADLVAHFGVADQQCDIVYNPYDIDHISELASAEINDLPARPYIIGTGRLVKNKNFSLMIRAFAQSRLTCDLVILGQGDEQAALQALAAQLGVADRVHLLGFKANPYPYLKQAEFFVSTSNAEGFPNAIVEAMCLQKAVIATNCESGPAEILSGQYPYPVSQCEPVEHGILCPVNDADAVCVAMNALCDPARVADYAKRSAKRAEDFSYAIFEQRISACLALPASQPDSAYVHSG